MYKLRPYQDEAATQGVYHLQKYSKPFVIQAATGAGKSLIIAEICHRLNEPVLVLQPSKEILEQNYAKLKSYGIEDVSMYSASVGVKEIAKYTYATIGSIRNRPELFKHFRYAVVDECHQVDPKNLEKGMYGKFFRETGITNICGLTATPYRIVNKFVTDEYGQQWYTGTIKMINRIHPFFFKKIVTKIETAELIEQGYLAPVDYFTAGFDFNELELNKSNTEFTPESVERYWNESRTKKIAEGIQHADGAHKRSLTFCSSIRQAQHVQGLCTAAGIRCSLVTGETTKKERELMLKGFKSGAVKHMLNVGVYTTGLDVPVLDCIILARPTTSLALYYQMVGRGIRVDPDSPEKILTVYDLAGLVQQLGRVETIRIKTEEGGYRDEIWSERGRLDEKAVFEFFVKKTPDYLRSSSMDGDTIF